MNDLKEYFTGVIPRRHRQCALQSQDHFVLWRCFFFPSCGNILAVKYSCRCMDRRVLESLTVSLFWAKIHFLKCCTVKDLSILLNCDAVFSPFRRLCALIGLSLGSMMPLGRPLKLTTKKYKMTNMFRELPNKKPTWT